MCFMRGKQHIIQIMGNDEKLLSREIILMARQRKVQATFASQWEKYLDYCSSSVFCLGSKILDSEGSKATATLPSDPETMVTNHHSEDNFLCRCVFFRYLQLRLETLLHNQPVPQSLQWACCPLLIWLVSLVSGWMCR